MLERMRTPEYQAAQEEKQAENWLAALRAAKTFANKLSDAGYTTRIRYQPETGHAYLEVQCTSCQEQWTPPVALPHWDMCDVCYRNDRNAVDG